MYYELTEKEQLALKLRKDGVTIEGVGKSLGVSRTRAAQLIRQAERKDRANNHTSPDTDFLFMIDDVVSNPNIATRIINILIGEGVTSIDGIRNFPLERFRQLEGVGDVCIDEYAKIRAKLFNE